MLDRMQAQLKQLLWNVRGAQSEVDVGGAHGALWHASKERLIRVLHDRHATAHLDRGQAQGTVAQCAREHHAHHSAAIGSRRRPKQYIDRGSRTVLAQPSLHEHVATPQLEMAVW